MFGHLTARAFPHRRSLGTLEGFSDDGVREADQYVSGRLANSPESLTHLPLVSRETWRSMKWTLLSENHDLHDDDVSLERTHGYLS